jgi:hypothetical protein
MPARRVRAVPAKTTLMIYAADLSSRPAVAGIRLSRSRLSQLPGGRLPASLTRYWLAPTLDPGTRSHGFGAYEEDRHLTGALRRVRWSCVGAFPGWWSRSLRGRWTAGLFRSTGP